MVDLRKLTKRQGILLTVMTAAILYGVADFFFLGAADRQRETSPKSPAAVDVKTLMAGAAASAGSYRPAGLDAYVIRRAESGWQRDPFIDGKVYNRWFPREAASTSTEKALFTYTGYLEVNRKRMAIINGMEYGVGDPLEVEGYAVKSISPAKVAVYRAGDKTTLEIPIQE
ncbi:MAG TPA: hypothetical protein PLB96_00950 [Syntrophales bacterium]|nr:hypothetical protein [Syntrophales bacterium]